MRFPVNAFVVLLLTILLSSVVLAQYSIDISGLKSEEYSLNEDINFEVILLDGEQLIEKNVEVTITDALGKKEVSKTVTSNQDASIAIKDDFPSGLWTMKAVVEEVHVERTFTVGANLEVEFEIVDDVLIIRNKGNVRYTKTVQITIGSVTNSYAQNIGVGEEKRLKLVSSEGTYNIVVTDGTATLKRENIQLYGTGNVVGAVDEELVGYTGFAGVEDLGEENGRFASLSKMPLAVTFIVGVLVLGILVVIERKLAKKRKFEP